MKMKYCGILILLAAQTYEQNKCGRVDLLSLVDELEFRVVGGNGILIQQSPWTAILELSKEQNEDKIEVFCGGTLISPKLITTAAHCLWGNKQAGRHCPEEFRKMKTAEECHNRSGGCPVGCRRLRAQDINVYLGVTSVAKRDRTPLAVEDIYIHELWDKSKLSDAENAKSGHDIALLQLSQQQIFSPKIQPICLPSLDLEIGVRNATIDGFGSVSSNILTRKNAQLLQRGIIPIWTKEACNATYKFTLMNDQLCASSQGVDSCRGDSGSGLTILMDGQPNTRVLIGITSFGSIFCGDDGRPGVYTSVQSHMDWIQTRMLRSTETFGPWTPCSTTCGPGITESRNSTCSEDYDLFDYYYCYDYDYDYEYTYTKECFNQPCQETVISLDDIFQEVTTNIGRILLVGGYVGAAKQSNQVFLQDCHYSVFEDVKVPSFPVNISVSAGQVLGDTVYVCGGFNGQFESQRHCFTFTFQPGEKWKEGPSLRTPRANAAMVATKSGLWITGGRNGPINFLDSTEFFNKSTGAWVSDRSIPPLTRKLGLHCALADESSGSERMIIIGGTWYDAQLEDFIKTDIVESYDLVTGESTPMPSLQTARSGHSCLLFPGEEKLAEDCTYKNVPYYILVVGGKTVRKKRLNSVEFFEAGASRWVYLEPLPSYISGAKLVLQNRRPLLIGGIVSEIGIESENSNPNDVNKFSDSVYEYDLVDDEWSLVGKVHETVAYHTAVALPDQLCQQENNVTKKDRKETFSFFEAYIDIRIV